jgi:hypothetical protein
MRACSITLATRADQISLHDTLCCAVLQVTKVFWDFRKGLIPIIGGSR